MSTGAATFERQRRLGLLLTGGLLSGWLCGHVYGVFLHRWTLAGTALAPVLALVQCWLNVGLFIIAHDCMHGSLAPFRPRLNRAIGRLCLRLYAGFSFDRLRPKHLLHHADPGTAADPDFDHVHPDQFAPWLLAFMRQYFGIREFMLLAGIALTEVYALGATWPNLIVFWAAPALLSAVQLFTFGTYLPHRRDSVPFATVHRARSSDYSWLMSLLSCFHFGYHHEHHVSPSMPWWRLPAVRKASLEGRLAGAD